MLKIVDIYTDGACSGNPGPGGWAAVLCYRGTRKEIFGAEPATTNNRMELTAIIEGLRALTVPCKVTVFSDSSYALNPFLEGWMNGWLRSGKLQEGGKLKNVELWHKLLDAMKQHDVSFVKVKGHSDNELNNRCDLLARTAIKNLTVPAPTVIKPE